MNISEFEKNKPRETLKAIRELEEYLTKMHKYGENNVPIVSVLSSLQDIKDKFLKGE